MKHFNKIIKRPVRIRHILNQKLWLVIISHSHLICLVKIHKHPLLSRKLMYMIFLIENHFYMCSKCRILRPNQSKRFQWDVQVSDHQFPLRIFELRSAAGVSWFWSLEQVSYNDFTYCTEEERSLFRGESHIYCIYINIRYHCPSLLNPPEGSVVCV